MIKIETLRHKHLSKDIIKYLELFLKEKDIVMSKKAIDIAIDEFFKFLIIMSEVEEEMLFIPISKNLDEIWHFFILQTKLYESLCNSIRPNYFLHHQTIPMQNYFSEDSQHDIKEEEMFILANYYKLFGEFNSENYKNWLAPYKLINENGWNLAKVNQLALEVCKSHESS